MCIRDRGSTEQMIGCFGFRLPSETVATLILCWDFINWFIASILSVLLRPFFDIYSMFVVTLVPVVILIILVFVHRGIKDSRYASLPKIYSWARTYFSILQIILSLVPIASWFLAKEFCDFLCGLWGTFAAIFSIFIGFGIISLALSSTFSKSIRIRNQCEQELMKSIYHYI
eukprot:TRINITY_DN16167_c0_g1_i1.p1 TRINITY_DN16167_c0_g1~~TRINITY_DN16167_c0_g1_i1.p1  ORF type:complete len:191 (-),score=26.60 TRINITY_DN16167_c0_g1_i1:89-604(-)